MTEEMKEYNWNWWFVLSIIWILSLLFIAMVDGSKSAGWFMTLNMVLSMVNAAVCLYVGNKPR